MREIAGPGAVAGRFVDYDAVTNPNGTVYTADYGNDIQDELIALQDHFTIAEAAGTNEYVMAAIKGIAIQFGKTLGEMFYLDSVKLPVAFDKDDPETFFPGICLDTIDGSTDLAAANWPDLVTHLRAKGLTYNEGISGQKSTFDVTDWAIVSNVAQLTFANTTAEIAIFEALSEDNLVHGSYVNWRSITLSGAIGDISAGEYAITDIDPVGRKIDFTFTAGNNSGSGIFTSNFYTNRVPSSTTTARLFEATARTLVSANDDEGENINGLRRRDRGQGWQAGAKADTTGGRNYWSRTAGRDKQTSAINVANNTYPIFDTTSQGLQSAIIPVDDGTNSTPRIGKTTDPRSAVGHLYLWGKSYTA